MQTTHQRQILVLMLLALFGNGMVKPVSAQQGESADVIAEVVVSGLDAPTDFSVAYGGNTSEVIFIAEKGAQQIRRVQGETDEVVVDGIVEDDQSPESISVHAINPHQILVGAKGFLSVEQALHIFETSTEALPLDFNSQHVKHSTSYRDTVKRTGGISVLRFFTQQRGLAMVSELDEAAPVLSNLNFKNGNLEGLEYLTVDKAANLSTVTVDRLGGYLVAMAQDEPNRIVFLQGDGTLMQSFRVDLENIVGLCFSPNHNRLYAIVGNSNNSPKDSGGDGIYEILADGEKCKSRFVIAVQRPQKIKFDAQGNAWVLCQSDTESSIGHLQRIKNLDVSPTMKQFEEQASDED